MLLPADGAPSFTEPPELESPLVHSFDRPGNEKSQMVHSLGVCVPVWNRGELFRIAFDALLEQLDGVDATIWLFDNGSEPETRRIVEQAHSRVHRIHKVFLPQNMGIPYVANVFARAVSEDCDFAGYRAPSYVLLMDADAYFQAPIRDLLELHASHYPIGVLSGHDSIEHSAIEAFDMTVGGRTIRVKRKNVERMITMLMRREEFLLCHPFPHYRNRDVDWELALWNPNAFVRRGRGIYVACDYALYLGIGMSTWAGPGHVNASPEESAAVTRILRQHALRRA